MNRSPEIALLVSSYLRPQHLRRSLLSIAMQRGVSGQMEVVVTDDGSTDETPQVVQEFAQSVDFPVRLTTHPHTTFQLARCRNEGAAASTAAYLLFLDGDCLLPPDHVAIHLQRRQKGVVWAGNRVLLDASTSERIDDEVIRHGEFVQWACAKKLRWLRNKGRKYLLYELLRHPTKPRLVGNNVAIWRKDYERVNGYDENFEGWGAEDDDLGNRVHRAGLHVRSILRWTNTYHLWHPVDVTAPVAKAKTRNWEYLHRKGALVCCRNGLVKRPLEDLRIRVVGNLSPAASWLSWLLGDQRFPTEISPEIEVVFLPGPGKFSGQAQCNVLVVTDATPTAAKLAKRAHVVVADCDLPASRAQQRFGLRDFPDALNRLC